MTSRGVVTACIAVMVTTALSGAAEIQELTALSLAEDGLMAFTH